MGLMRIPYTAPLPAPNIFPATAATLSGAVNALHEFLTGGSGNLPKTLLLTGAGISVASGLADYRGTAGTYTLNKTYRPVYFHEFCASHEARKRYWARSFMGWTNLNRSRPNPAHHAVARLGQTGLLTGVITQNVDSFHLQAHPDLATLELHGYLRNVVCLSCRTEHDRATFQQHLAVMNPQWAHFLSDMLAVGALATEDPMERRKLGLETNPDGDVDVPTSPGLTYSTFKYPKCPNCFPSTSDAMSANAEATTGILKPAVIMFGESIPTQTKLAAEKAIDSCDRLLVLGSSLATYSAWRLVKRAHEARKPIAIANLGGARGEDNFFAGLDTADVGGTKGVRCSQHLEDLMPALTDKILGHAIQ